MTSSAFWAYGSLLQLSDMATPAVYATIGEVLELQLPQMSRDDIDVSSHSSVDGYREFIPGMRDGGEVSVKCNYLPTNSTQDHTTGVLSTFNTNTVYDWYIYVPSVNLTFPFSGFVTEWNPDLPLEEQAVIEFNIKVSGKPGNPF